MFSVHHFHSIFFSLHLLLLLLCIQISTSGKWRVHLRWWVCYWLPRRGVSFIVRANVCRMSSAGWENLLRVLGCWEPTGTDGPDVYADTSSHHEQLTHHYRQGLDGIEQWVECLSLMCQVAGRLSGRVKQWTYKIVTALHGARHYCYKAMSGWFSYRTMWVVLLWQHIWPVLLNHRKCTWW